MRVILIRQEREEMEYKNGHLKLHSPQPILYIKFEIEHYNLYP